MCVVLILKHVMKSGIHWDSHIFSSHDGTQPEAKDDIVWCEMDAVWLQQYLLVLLVRSDVSTLWVVIWSRFQGNGQRRHGSIVLDVQVGSRRVGCVIAGSSIYTYLFYHRPRNEIAVADSMIDAASTRSIVAAI